MSRVNLRKAVEEEVEEEEEEGDRWMGRRKR
jgi:hypothetical protein